MLQEGWGVGEEEEGAGLPRPCEIRTLAPQHGQKASLHAGVSPSTWLRTATLLALGKDSAGEESLPCLALALASHGGRAGVVREACSAGKRPRRESRGDGGCAGDPFPVSVTLLRIP